MKPRSSSQPIEGDSRRLALTVVSLQGWIRARVSLFPSEVLAPAVR